MSKELTPLEAVEELKQNNKVGSHLFDDELLDIVETALKDYEHLYQLWNCKDSDTMIIQTTKTIHDENNKKLQALEIIKDNKINELELVWYNGMWFVFAPNCPRAIMYGTRKEDYDLLKEALK